MWGKYKVPEEKEGGKESEGSVSPVGANTYLFSGALRPLLDGRAGGRRKGAQRGGF